MAIAIEGVMLSGAKHPATSNDAEAASLGNATED
jgi:hypothetical protein